MASRRRSLLEDESVAEVSGRDETSDGDVCERCGRTRGEHTEDNARSKSKCEQFEE